MIAAKRKLIEDAFENSSEDFKPEQYLSKKEQKSFVTKQCHLFKAKQKPAQEKTVTPTEKATLRR